MYLLVVLQLVVFNQLNTEQVLFIRFISDGGSGYTSPPTVTITGGNPGAGFVEAKATCTIANGEVVTVTIIEVQRIQRW